MNPWCSLCKKRKIWASIIAKLPSKPNNSRVDLTSKLQIQERWSTSDMHFGRMHTLSESFGRLGAACEKGSLLSFGAWSLRKICRKHAACSHHIHQGSVCLPECVMCSWSSYRMGFERCRFQKDLSLSWRVWVNSRWKYSAGSHKAASPDNRMTPSRSVSVFLKPCCIGYHFGLRKGLILNFPPKMWSSKA